MSKQTEQALKWEEAKELCLALGVFQTVGCLRIIADALAQARREEREAACQEISEYSGITAEQTEALCKAIRQREGA